MALCQSPVITAGTSGPVAVSTADLVISTATASQARIAAKQVADGLR